MSVTPISEKGITPEVLVETIARDAPKIDKLFCVALSKSGEVWEYYSGDAGAMALAALIMQHAAKKRLRSVRQRLQPS